MDIMLFYAAWIVIYVVLKIANMNMPRNTPGFITFQKLAFRCTACRRKNVKTSWRVNKRLCPSCNNWWRMTRWERLYIKLLGNRILIWSTVISIVVGTLYLLLLNYTNVIYWHLP